MSIFIQVLTDFINSYLGGCQFVTSKNELIKKLNFYTFTAKNMDTTAIFNYFSEILEGEPEKIEVLSVLMDINGNEEGIIDFIDYYGFDVDELNEDIREWYEDKR